MYPAPTGTLYVSENIGPGGTTRIVTVTAQRMVSPYVEYIPGSPALAVHPKNGDVYFAYETGLLYRVTGDSAAPELFASNLGSFQSMEFSESGLSLFVSATERDQIIEIRGKRCNRSWPIAIVQIELSQGLRTSGIGGNGHSPGSSVCFPPQSCRWAGIALNDRY